MSDGDYTGVGFGRLMSTLLLSTTFLLVGCVGGESLVTRPCTRPLYTMDRLYSLSTQTPSPVSYTNTVRTVAIADIQTSLCSQLS